MASTASMLVATVVFAAGWFTLATKRAAHQPLWLDEVFALRSSVRGSGAMRLLLRGAPGQGSPAPLDYLLVKALDEARRATAYLGLEPHAYFRLVSLISSLGAGLCVCALGLGTTRRAPMPSGAVAGGLVAFIAMAGYLLDPLILHYPGEMRPYALWAALWLVAAVSSFSGSRRRRLTAVVALVLLALTATAALFELAAIALSVFVSGSLAGSRPVDAGRRTFKVFVIPLALSAFYCLIAGHWNYPPSWCTWARFFPFWLSHWWVAAASALGVVCALSHREAAAWAVAPMALLVLYLFGPAIFFATKLSGFFFTERQYLYYATALPITLGTCAFAVTSNRSTPQGFWRRSLAGLVALFCLFGTARVVRRTAHEVRDHWNQWQETPGVPSDPQHVLSQLLSRELPRDLCFVNEPSAEATANVDLFADWLPVHYRSLPVGETSVLLAAERDGAQVVGTAAACRSGHFVTIRSMHIARVE